MIAFCPMALIADEAEPVLRLGNGDDARGGEAGAGCDLIERPDFVINAHHAHQIVITLITLYSR